MKKASILVLFIHLLFPFSIFSQWSFELRSDFSDVEKIETNSYNYRSDSFKDYVTIHNYFDGRVIRYQRFTKGKLARDQHTTYIKENNKEIVVETNGITGESDAKFFKYDKQNRIKSWAYYNLENQDIDYSRNLTNYIYNRRGHMISQVVSNVQNGWKNRINYKMNYPNDSTVIRLNINSIYNRVDLEIQYEYDTTNNAAIETGILYGYLYLDENNQPIYEGNTLFIEADYHDMIKRNGRKMMVKKSISKTKYIYDDRGNWIEAYTIKKDGQEQLIRQRKITYR